MPNFTFGTSPNYRRISELPFRRHLRLDRVAGGGGRKRFPAAEEKRGSSCVVSIGGLDLPRRSQILRRTCEKRREGRKRYSVEEVGSGFVWFRSGGEGWGFKERFRRKNTVEAELSLVTPCLLTRPPRLEVKAREAL
nr:hypothetical protein Iba_chr03aCG9370 [Ipomoea batatas]